MLPDLLRCRSAARYPIAMTQTPTALDVVRQHLAKADQECTSAAVSLAKARERQSAADVAFWRRAHGESLAAWAALRRLLDELEQA